MKNNRTNSDGSAKAGSQKQIQYYVNQQPDELNRQILTAMSSLKEAKPRQIRWVSPLASEQYVEYFDQGFLRAVGHPELTDALMYFWPLSGPRWDALAVVEFEDPQKPTGVILLEAKSHRLELFSTGTSKVGKNQEKIKNSIDEALTWLGIDDQRIHRRHQYTGILYQHANRYAHLYFLNQIGNVPTWLVNAYFLNDPYRRTSKAQWEDFLPEVKWQFSGQENFTHPLSADVFLESTMR